MRISPKTKRRDGCVIYIIFPLRKISFSSIDSTVLDIYSLSNRSSPIDPFNIKMTPEQFDWMMEIFDLDTMSGSDD